MIVGLEGVSAMTSAVLVESAVVLVPMMSPRFARPLWRQWAPSLVALAGIVLLVGGGGEPCAADAAATPAAVALSLFSAGMFAAHTVRTDEYDDVEPVTQALGQVGVAAGLDVLYLASCADTSTAWLDAAAGGPQLAHLLLAAGWCGVVTCAFTTWAQSYAQQAFSTTTAALAYALDPVFAALFAALLLHESLDGAQALGGALVVAANLAADAPAGGGDARC